ncbi:MAG: hypothetical protein IT368_03785, partial [Candidatus Hydrogenedentes bacterium]|nr:hypothetical protein [Candidatus Hydrogenedentota bacterium]
VFDESVSEAPLEVEGAYVDLFDPQLPVLHEVRLTPGERGLYYDLAWARAKASTLPIAAAARIKGWQADAHSLRFTARGPRATTGRARILLPGPPTGVATEPALAVDQSWDAESSTLLLTFENTAADVTFVVDF